MNGAQSILETAARAGVEVCFANPGTTEIHLVGAFDEVPAIRPILGLFEGVCTGAADGYGRIAGRPALTLLHLGPGLANGAANLHNAQKAATPLINLIGTHATRHLNNDSILNSDIPGIARPVSLFVREIRVADEAARDFAVAYQAAVAQRGVATLIVPADVQWDDVTAPPPTEIAPWRGLYDDDRVAAAAAALRADAPAALLLGGEALLDRGLLAAGRIQAAAGCRLFCKWAPARIESGPHLPVVERLGYFPEASAAQVADVATFVLAGADAPAAIFAYRDGPSQVIPPGRSVVHLARPADDVVGALEALADHLRAPQPKVQSRPRPQVPGGGLSARTFGAVLAALVPEGAVYVDEANTSAPDFFEHAAGSAQFSYLGLTGGSIGIGSPLGTGAAVAATDRPVVVVQGDGSALYTLQALWTQAREQLDVTTLICANRSYDILKVEQVRAGIARLGPRAAALMDLTEPVVDWVKLAEGLGVPASSASTVADLGHQLRTAVDEAGPHLIEVVLE